MFDTELSSSSLAVDDLRVIGISLRLHLVNIVLLEYLGDVLGLMHLHHVRVDSWPSIIWLISFESVLLSWCHYCLLGIRRANVVFLMTLSTSNTSVIGSLILVANLDHLLR